MESDFGKKFFVLFAAGVVFLALPIVSIERQALDAELSLGSSAGREHTLLPVAEAADPAPQKLRVWVTAYSSTPEETDDTPFLTAWGTEVRKGIIAANFLPFGAQVQIPELFGDRVFTVEDRMHERKRNFIDIWMSSKELAEEFGITKAEIVVLN